MYHERLEPKFEGFGTSLGRFTMGQKIELDQEHESS